MIAAPTPAMAPNSVQVASASFGQGASAGRVIALGAPGPTLRCAVEIDDSKDIDRSNRETLVNMYKVVFFADPGVKLRDQLFWVDYSPAKILSVTGTRPIAGRLRTWVVDCEEVV